MIRKLTSSSMLFMLLLIPLLLTSCGDKRTPDDSVKEIVESPDNSSVKPSGPYKRVPAEDSARISAITSAAEARRANQLFDDATQLMREGDYKTALEKLNESIKIGEGIKKPIQKAYISVGRIHQSSKDYRNAILSYEKYLENPDADKIKILERISEAYYNWGMLYNRLFNAAVNLHLDYYKCRLDKFDNIGPKEIVAIRYFRGLEYYLSRQFDEAIANLEKMSGKFPQYDVLAKIKLAACYYQKGQKKKAERVWSTIRNRASSDILIASELWRTYLEVGKPIQIDEVEKISQWLSSQQPSVSHYSKVRSNLVAIYSMINDLDQSLNLFTSDDLQTPDLTITVSKYKAKFFQPSLFKSMAMVYFLKAREYYLECIQTSPSNADYYKYQIGLCLLQANKIDEAAETFSEISSSLFKSKAEIHKAACLYLKGEEQKAFQIWDQIAKQSSAIEDTESLSELSYVYARLGIRLQEALKYAIESGKSSKLALVYFQLGFQSEKQDQRITYFAEASRLLNGSCSTISYYLEVNDPLVLIDLANAYYHRHTFDESAKIWSHFSGKYPEVCQILNSIQLVNEVWQMRRSEEFRFQWVDPIS